MMLKLERSRIGATGEQRLAIDGFSFHWDGESFALLVSSACPSVLAKTYDFIKSESDGKLLSCQSLYDEGRHALLFFLASEPAGALLNELDGAPLSWTLMRPVSGEAGEKTLAS